MGQPSKTRPDRPDMVQYLLAPLTMRRIRIWMLDHALTFDEARRWNALWTYHRIHLRETYGRRWKRLATAEELTNAKAMWFTPQDWSPPPPSAETEV